MSRSNGGLLVPVLWELWLRPREAEKRAIQVLKAATQDYLAKEPIR